MATQQQIQKWADDIFNQRIKSYDVPEEFRDKVQVELLQPKYFKTSSTRKPAWRS